MAKIVKLLHRGWQIVEGIHTALWLLGGLSAIVSGVMTWWAVASGLAPVEIAVIAIVVFAAMFLAMLGAVGIGSEATASNDFGRTVAPQTAASQKAKSARSWIHVAGPDPAYICGFYEAHMNAEADRLAKPYIGQKITLRGTLNDIRASKDFSHMYFQTRHDELRARMSFTGEAKKKIDLQSRGAKLEVVGALEEADAYSFALDNCEFRIIS